MNKEEIVKAINSLTQIDHVYAIDSYDEHSHIIVTGAELDEDGLIRLITEIEI